MPKRNINYSEYIKILNALKKKDPCTSVHHEMFPLVPATFHWLFQSPPDQSGRPECRPRAG